MPKRFIPVIVIVSIAVGFAGGFLFQGYREASISKFTDISNRDAGRPEGVDFTMFWDAWNVLQKKYVDRQELDTQELVYGAIDGLVRAVGDPYTTFLKPKESEEFSRQIQGTFSGVGVEIGIRKEILTVISPIKDTPAFKAGLLAGDKILKIDGKSTEGMKVEEAVQLIRGPKGTQVTLTIARDGLEKAKDFIITRDNIKIPAVAWELKNDNIAYLEIFTFNKNVDSEFKKAAEEIIKSQASKIVLDLRNNPGGLLDSAVNIAGYFLENDSLVTIERFGDGRTNEFRAQPNGLLKSYPIVVLINKGSASASEILAGALKDNKGVIIVGETSFGKGSVQEVVDLPKESSLKVTIAKWLTPNGHSINDNGIKPDVEVKRTEEDVQNERDPQLEKALDLIKNL